MRYNLQPSIRGGSQCRSRSGEDNESPRIPLTSLKKFWQIKIRTRLQVDLDLGFGFGFGFGFVLVV